MFIAISINTVGRGIENNVDLISIYLVGRLARFARISQHDQRATDIKGLIDIPSEADIVQTLRQVVNTCLEILGILSIEAVRDSTIEIHRYV